LRRHLHETGRGRLLEDRHVIVTIGTGYLGSWHRTLRLLAATLSVGGSDKALRNEAVRQLTAALGAHRAVGAVGFEIRTHLDLAAVEAAGGKDAAFENHLEAARSLAREHDLAAILSRRDFRP